MTWGELVLGDHFVFLGANGRHVHMKQSEVIYYTPATRKSGVVGWPKRAVRRVACPTHVPASLRCSLCLSEIDYEERQS